MKTDNIDRNYKAEKINMLWIFAFGIFALIWVTYMMSPQRATFQGREVTGVSKSQLRNTPQDTQSLPNETEYQSLPNPTTPQQ